ncbi:hypothetical protein NDU88_001024, partial [Pleurodeles waltl]
EEKPLLDYIYILKKHLQTVWEDMRKHLEKAQNTQKKYYDKRTKPRYLQPNYKVLILRPCSDNKLLAKWQGPYTILKAIFPVTYLVKISKNPNRTQIYHITLLKKWEEPTIVPNQSATGFL